MGHGCHYTLDSDRNTKAVWLDNTESYGEDFDDYWIEEDLATYMQQFGWASYRAGYKEIFFKGAYEVTLKHTYNGDVLFDMNIANESLPYIGLLEHNLPYVYYALMRKFVKRGLTMRIACSAWTSGTFE